MENFYLNTRQLAAAIRSHSNVTVNNTSVSNLSNIFCQTQNK